MKNLPVNYTEEDIRALGRVECLKIATKLEDVKRDLMDLPYMTGIEEVRTTVQVALMWLGYAQDESLKESNGH